jgi:hypothetical protein
MNFTRRKCNRFGKTKIKTQPTMFKTLPTFSLYSLRAIACCLITVFSLGQSAFAQIYSHNFDVYDLTKPQVKNVNINASWSANPGSLYKRVYDNNNGLGNMGQNHVYVLTVQMVGNYQTEITSISFKRVSGDNATFQIKVADQNYGTNFTSDNNLTSITKTKTVSKLRNTFTIKIAVTNGSYPNYYSQIDNFVVNGTVSAFDPAAEATPSSEGILYVDKNKSTPGNGSSWALAMKEISYGLKGAKTKPAIKQIWVAAGDYQPDVQGQSFSLVNGVKVYGGFSGGENSLAERNTLQNPTTLKGRGTSVISNNDLNGTALLDGFYISEGSGFLKSGSSFGGGMYNTNSSPTIVNCVFTNNQTDPTKEPGLGGGMYNFNSNPSVTQCLFYSNKAKGTSQGAGGGIFNDNSSPVITNCTFTENEVSGTSTAGNGAAIALRGTSSPTIRNSIFWNNTDSSIPAGLSSISIFGSSDGTPVISYSLVQGGYAGGNHIIDQDPKFASPADQDYTQSKTSPVINAGDPATVLSVFTVNSDNEAVTLSGLSRLTSATIDLGPFEIYPISTWHVNAVSTAIDPDGLSWPASFATLQQALNVAHEGDQIWVAKGEYKPAAMETFYMIPGVKFYGGFVGNESSPDQRPFPIPVMNDPGATILSGNGSNVILNDGNGLGSDDLLDGFTIKGGNAENGAGMANYDSNPTIQNSAFIDNTATGNGGAIFNQYSYSMINNTYFVNNKALAGYGGGIVSAGGELTLNNCSFYSNTATSGGGAVANFYSALRMHNCTLYSNSADAGGAISNLNSSESFVYNSIIYGNSSGIESTDSDLSVSYSLVQGLGANSEKQNLDGTTDPQFVDATSFDFNLRPCSPAINRGINDAVQEGLADINGNPRIFNAQIDMGAYELQNLPVAFSLPLNNESVTLPVYTGVTALTEDCITLALLEPASSDGVQGNIAAKVYVATGQTITSGSKVFVKRHYDLTPVEENGAARVTLFFTKQEFDDYNTAYGNAHSASLPENLKVLQYHGTSPTGLPETYSGTTELIENVVVNLNAEQTIYSVSFNVTSFSGFYVSGQPAGALPVTLVSFKAAKAENQAFLSWQTTNEANSSAFEIEHSLNGKNWAAIGKVEAAGESSDIRNYSFLHKTPENGNNLYRLKMIDIDETFAYSSISSVTFNEITESMLYPNPALNMVKINLGNSDLSDVKKLVLYDQKGRIMYSKLQPDSNEIDISYLPSGTFVVHIILKNGVTQSAKLAVAK